MPKKKIVEELKTEEQIDQEIKERTAGFDQPTVERARFLGVNPDNFETMDELVEAVRIREAEDLLIPELKETEGEDATS
jgi:hypothetical protein